MFRNKLNLRLLMHFVAMSAILLGLALYKTSNVKAELDLNSPLLVNTRTRLHLCVGVSPELQPRNLEIRERLQTSLHTLKNTNPHWNIVYGADNEVPTLENNCKLNIPAGSLSKDYNANAVGLGNVTNPTPYRTVFLVLDEQRADLVLGSAKVMLIPYEMMLISEHENVEVTTAVVLRESAIEDSEIIELHLPIGMGLEPARPISSQE